MLRIGHRGAKYCSRNNVLVGLPENTLLAINSGIEQRSDLVELDVQRTCDGQFVIMHDKRVDRTTNGSGLVSQMSVEELRRLDAGQGQQIPILDEVLPLASGRVGLMLEIITPNIALDLFRAVERHRFRGPVIFASFHHNELLAIPEGPKLALLEGVPVNPAVFALDAKASHVGISVESITFDYVRALRGAGLQVFVYTVDDPRDVEWLRSMEVDGIISNRPEIVPKG
jgi:glycerophosphoryl diester phosphodiesterase